MMTVACDYCAMLYGTKGEAQQCMKWHIEALPNDLHQKFNDGDISLADAWKEADSR